MNFGPALLRLLFESVDKPRQICSDIWCSRSKIPAITTQTEDGLSR